MNTINDTKLFYLDLAESFEDMNDKIVYGFPERIFYVKHLYLIIKIIFLLLKGVYFMICILILGFNSNNTHL